MTADERSTLRGLIDRCARAALARPSGRPGCGGRSRIPGPRHPCGRRKQPVRLNHCCYCGRRCYGITCYRHRDLLSLDPLAPLSHAQERSTR